MQEMMDELTVKIRGLIGEDINPDSPDQIAELLFERLQI